MPRRPLTALAGLLIALPGCGGSDGLPTYGPLPAEQLSRTVEEAREAARSGDEAAAEEHLSRIADAVRDYGRSGQLTRSERERVDGALQAARRELRLP